MKKTCLILLPLILLCFPATAQNSGDTIHINISTELQLIGNKLAFFEDTNASLSHSEILSPATQEKFENHEMDVFAGPPTNSAIWFKFIVQNNSDQDIWLESGGAYSAWHIDFYRPDSAGNYIDPVKSGALRPSENKEHPSEFYWFKLADANDTRVKTFYVRIQSGVSPELPFYIGTLDALNSQRQKMLSITFVFLGMMGIMFLYNLFLYAATKDKIYLSYVFFVFMNALCFTFNNNFSLFGDHFWWWQKHIAWQFVGDLSSTIFIIHFLGLRKNLPIAFKIYIGLMLADFALALLNLLGVETFLLMNKYMLITLLLVANTIFTGIYLLIKRQRNAKIFLISWSFLLTSFVVFIMVINGALPYNTFTRYSVYLGLALEALLFSMALADRLNSIRKEKEAVLSENIKLVQNNNLMLEKAVKERTDDLAVKNKKLHVALENVNKQKQQINQQNKKLLELSSYKEEMTSMIVHDLKNPLNAIMNLTENERVSQKAQNMLDLVHHILDVHKNSDTQIILNLKPHLLNNVAALAIEEVSFLAKNEGISIVNQIDQQIWIKIDKGIIQRVFINILSNAIKFTPQKGHVFLSAEYIDQDSVKISISDTGPGIPLDKINTVFDKYGQVEERSSGFVRPTGIGLTYCKMAVKAHGGYIGAESNQGQGATFWFTLPAAEKQSEPLKSVKGHEKIERVFNQRDRKEIDTIKNALSHLKYFEAGEILQILLSFDVEKESKVGQFVEEVKQSIYTGSSADYDKLINKG